MSYIRGGSTRPGARGWNWNLEFGNRPELVRPPDLLTLRIRNSEACVQIPDSNPILGIWELGRWGSTWNLTEALGFQFRNSENEITVPLLHTVATRGSARARDHSQSARARHARLGRRRKNREDGEVQGRRSEARTGKREGETRTKEWSTLGACGLG